MNLTVVIPAYNNLADVMCCLNSLQAFQQGPVEYVVQDDASPDVNLLATVPASVGRVQRNSVNLGFAGNCNAGAARAHGDVLFFVNQDVYAVHQWSIGWNQALVRLFDRSYVGIVGARLLFPNGSVQNAGGEFDAKHQPTHRCLGWSNPHHPEVSTPRAVGWTTGAALAIRKDLFEQVGGFDTAYRGGYFEDTDLCMKVRRVGYDIWYDPRCTLIHQVGQSGGNPAFARNASLFRERWYDDITPDIHVVKEMFW